MRVTVLRVELSEEHTIGILYVDGEVVCWTMELPWRGNKKNVSCIPPGMYVATKIASEEYGHTLWVDGVPGRSDIIFHIGNSVKDTRGCILLGSTPGYVEGKRWVFKSTAAMTSFREAIHSIPMGGIVTVDIRTIWV